MYRTLTLTLTLTLGFGLAVPSTASSLFEVAESALINHPELKIAELVTSMDQQQALIQRSSYAPQVAIGGSVGINAQNTSGPENFATTGEFTVSKKLYDINGRMVQAGLDLKVEKSQLEALETGSKVLLDVTQRYIQAATAIDKMNLKREEQLYNDQLLISAKHKYKLQEIYITDVHTAQANYDLAVADTLVAITEVDTALASLSEISGVQVDAFDPEIQLVTTTQQHSLEYWQTQAQEANYGIKAARMESSVALKALDAHAYANSPVIDAELAINKQIYRGGTNLTPDTGNGSFVVSLNMPLYQGGRVAAQKQHSKDSYNITLQEQQKLEQELTSRVTAQYLHEQAMQKRIEAITKALESTVKATNTIRTSLGYGVSTQAQLLASTKQEFQLQLQLKQAKYQATLSNMQLRQMAGQLTLEYLRDLPKQLQGKQAPKKQVLAIVPGPVVTPLPKATLETKQPYNDAMLKLPSDHYSLQVLSASLETTLEAFIQKRNITQTHYAIKLDRGGEPWYMLLVGDYESASDARDAITSLPVSFQDQQPWARPVLRVQQQIRNKFNTSNVTLEPKPAPVLAPWPKATLKTKQQYSYEAMLKLPSDHYSLQVLSARLETTLEEFIQMRNITQTHYAIKLDVGGEPWYMLLVGDYESASDARDAITSLPVEFQNQQPLARPVLRIQQQIRNKFNINGE
jgi:outer membrane protein